MTKLFRNFVLLLAGLLVVSMLASCSGDDEILIEPGWDFVSATPSSGSTIAANASITITFNNYVSAADVRVNPGTVKVAGKTVTVTGPFSSGALALTILWADSNLTLHYTVTAPD